MDFSEVFFAIILGIFAGFVGRALVPGKQAMGLFMTMVLGIAGSFVGFLLFTKLLGIGDSNAFDWGGVIGAVIGVVLILLAYGKVVGDRAAPSQPA